MKLSTLLTTILSLSVTDPTREVNAIGVQDLPEKAKGTFSLSFYLDLLTCLGA